RHLADGKKFAKDSGYRPGLAETHFHHAEILHKKGDLDGVREELVGAEALFADLGMIWWPDQAEGLRRRIERGEPFEGFAPYADGPPAV
ncbi:MAG: hypothetical protein V3S29_09210, partial [bacterium]